MWLLRLAGTRLKLSVYAQVLRDFSCQAVWVVVLLIGAALLTAGLLTGFRLDLGSPYQLGLLAKVGGIALLLCLATWNLYYLSSRIEAKPAAARRLRWSITAEMANFAVILAVTAWPTTFQTPHVDTSQDTAQAVMPVPSGPIAIIDPWAPVTLTSLGTGAGYMIIANNQTNEDTLLSARSPWAEHVSLHASKVQDTAATMRNMSGMTLPARGRLILAPRSYHLMFTGLYSPFVAGDEVPLILTFARAGELAVTVKVRPLGYESGHEH